MKSIRLLILLLTINSFTTWGQQQEDKTCLEGIKVISKDENKLFGKAFINKFIGKDEQFLCDWVKGDVFLTDNNVVQNKYLRYNGYLDEILWMRDEDYQVAILDRKNVQRVKLYASGNRPEVVIAKVNHKNYQRPENNDMYLQVISEGKVTLYKKMEVTENNSNGTLVIKEFYFLFINGEFQRFQPKKVLLYKVLKDDRKTIKHIVRSNKLKIRKEFDLKRAIDLYNQN